MNWVEKETTEDSILSEEPSLRLPRLDLIAGVVIAIASALYAGLSGITPPSLNTPQHASADFESIVVDDGPDFDIAIPDSEFWKERQEAITAQMKTLDLKAILEKASSISDGTLHTYQPVILGSCEGDDCPESDDAEAYRLFLEHLKTSAQPPKAKPSLQKRAVRRVAYLR